MAQFKKWLKTQRNRNDAIGTLATAAASDSDFPSVNDVDLIVHYLADKGANNKLLKTFRQAYKEFEFSIDEIRENFEAKEQAPPAPKKRGRRPVNNTDIEVEEKPVKKSRKPKFVPAEITEPAPAPLPAVEPTPEIIAIPKRRGRPKKEAEEINPDQPEIAPAKRAPKPKEQPGTLRLPNRLEALQQQMKDAALLLDSQFGKGFSKDNPDKVIQYAQVLQTAEQNKAVRTMAAELAQVLIKFGKL